MHFVSIVIAGCGHQRVPVAGRLVYDDGSPYVGGGVVVMETVSDGKRIMKRAPIAPDGTFDTAWGRAPGVIAGTYRGRIVPPSEGEVGQDALRPILFDKKFLSFETSQLEWVVGPGGSSSDFVINLGRRPATR